MMFSSPLLALLLTLQLTLGTRITTPNVILFVIDDLGWMDTSYMGAEYSTPTMDRLAAEGVRLKQYYVDSLCTPSRAALLTGRYAYHLGLAHSVIGYGTPYGLNLSEVTLAQRMKEAGYATHAVGKWHVGMYQWEHTPTYRGFDSFYGFYNAAEDHYNHSHFNGLDLRDNTEAAADKNGTYSTNLFTEKILSILANHNAEMGPFFIYAAYQSLHEPMQVPEHYMEKCPFLVTNERLIICGMMQAIDEGIRNITESLETEGYLDNTIIILTTDNGGSTLQGSRNWPLRGGKGTLWEGGVRGLSFVWGRQLHKKNYDYTGLMHITDWYRTIVEGIAAYPLSQEEVNRLDGLNMWDVINTHSPSPHKEVLLQLDPPYMFDGWKFYPGQAAIRVENWKLYTGAPNCSAIEGPFSCNNGWTHLNGTVESGPENPALIWLFNLATDPTERNNLAGIRPEIVSRLRERIEHYNSSHVIQMFTEVIDPRSNPLNFGGVWTPWADRKKL